MNNTAPQAGSDDLSGDSFALPKRREPHYEMRRETVKNDYEKGLITTAGYLYYLIKTTRKDGWRFHIKNVNPFCEDAGFSRTMFYKAKAKLINEGLIEEEITGGLDLWIPSEKEKLQTKVDTVQTKVCTDPPETQAEQTFQEPFRSSSDLLQISLSQEGEREIFLKNLFDPENQPIQPFRE